MVVVWLVLQDILANKSIRDALVYEESFFRSKPVSRKRVISLIHYFVTTNVLLSLDQFNGNLKRLQKRC